MTIQRLIAGLVDFSQRHAVLVILAGLLLAGGGGLYAARHLSVSTNTNDMFAETLPWRQRLEAFNRDFPQLTDLLVVVIDARIPEEADATAADLAKALQADRVHFDEVRRPDSSPFFAKEGLLLLDKKQVETSLETVIDAQAFLGELAADPSARGLFSALSLVGTGVQQGTADLSSFLPALKAFHLSMANVIAGHPEPLSWNRLLGGELADVGGPYKFVLFKTKQQFGALRPGGAATEAIREAAAGLEFVKTGEAHVRITGPVALADDEFASVAQGAVTGLIGSVVLITVWLFLAVRSWRLILPILFTLGVGLVFTLVFAAAAIGTLNLVSVGFGILFVGIAVDFAIQFSVRYRDRRRQFPDRAMALVETGRRAGIQILVAATATAAGFLGFAPTPFRGVAELGEIAGAGMIIAFLCTMIFLPAMITVMRPPGESAEVGFHWAARLDEIVRRKRKLLVAVFALVAVSAVAMLPRLVFDADPLHTKDASTEAMRTLRDLINSPVTNPFTIDLLTPSAADAAIQAQKLSKLPLVDGVVSINSFVPTDQSAKLALIADAGSLLGPTLTTTPSAAPVTPEEIRAAALKALKQIDLGLPKLPADHPLAAIANDLRQLAVANDQTLLDANRVVARFLPTQIEQLTNLLAAQPLTLQSIPTEISRDWLLPNGVARVQLLSTAEARNSAGLKRFVQQVTAAAPDAGGSAVTIVATSATIIDAFQSATFTALAAISVILFITLRRLLDMALVLAPLLLSALMTGLVVVVLGLPLNYANIIALPLLLGVGVSFNIYFVMNWRAGQISVLGSATARAILFSALTTATAFGSLALSRHPGTASMGVLLLISLACTLVASLAFIPALLATVPNQPDEAMPTATGLLTQAGK